MPEQFWFNDPSVLFRQETWTRFVPTKCMTTTEALNAVVRFTIYSSVLLSLFTGTQSYLIAIPVVAIASVALHQLFPNGKKLETFLGEMMRTTPLTTRENFTMPTPQNPFMNVLLTEITDNPNRGDAAPVSDKQVRAQIYKAFQQTSDIYMDTSDLFDQTQAMRTFHTLQSAKVPNDQDAFLAWLAKGYDDVDTSSAFPSRGGKILSEGYVNARGAMRNLDNATCKPSGTAPLSTDDATSTPAPTAT
jgi:hypothetical protein